MGGVPAPYIVSDRSVKHVINANLSPYVIGTLNSFVSLGINQSQAVEWLVVSYLGRMKQVEQPVKQTPKPKAQKVPKQPKKVKQAMPEKPVFVHQCNSGQIVKRAKVKPTK